MYMYDITQILRVFALFRGLHKLAESDAIVCSSPPTWQFRVPLEHAVPQMMVLDWCYSSDGQPPPRSCAGFVASDLAPWPFLQSLRGR